MFRDWYGFGLCDDLLLGINSGELPVGWLVCCVIFVMSVGRILWHGVMLCGFNVMTWFHFFSVGFCFV